MDNLRPLNTTPFCGLIKASVITMFPEGSFTEYFEAILTAEISLPNFRNESLNEIVYVPSTTFIGSITSKNGVGVVLFERKDRNYS